MPMILQIMEGLKVYGLLSAVERNPEMWRLVFVKEFEPKLTPTALSEEFEAVYNDSQLIREKESDVFYHFSTVVDSMEVK